MRNQDISRIVAAALPSIIQSTLDKKPLTGELIDYVSNDPIAKAMVKKATQEETKFILECISLQYDAVKGVKCMEDHAALADMLTSRADDSLATMAALAASITPTSANNSADVFSQMALGVSLYSVAGIAMTMSDSFSSIAHNESVAIHASTMVVAAASLAAVGFVGASIATGGLLPLGIAGTCAAVGGLMACAAMATHLYKQGALTIEAMRDKESASRYSANFKLTPDEQEKLGESHDLTQVSEIVRTLAMIYDKQMASRTIFEGLTASDTLVSAAAKKHLRDIKAGKITPELQSFLDTHDVATDKHEASKSDFEAYRAHMLDVTQSDAKTSSEPEIDGPTAPYSRPRA